MTSPPEKLAAHLETLNPEDRQEITAWLLGRPQRTPTQAWMLAPHQLRSALAGLPGGDSQLVTIRLPAESHAKLRAWCTEHNFTMASVIRGLVERFLEEQQPKN